MEQLHWSDMYQSKNDLINDKQLVDIIRNIPPKLKLPDGIKLKIYNFPIQKMLSKEMMENIIIFNNTHNQVGIYNKTLIDEEYLIKIMNNMTCFALLFDNGKIIGMMISIAFRTIYLDNKPMYTSYTTNLCIHEDYRNKGLAISLIGGIIKSGSNERKVYHGYYLSEESHQKINTMKIESWYRPINYIYLNEAGYQTIKNISKKVNQKIFYHVKNLSSSVDDNPLKSPSIENWEKALEFFKNDSIYMNPTFEEFKSICNLFNVHLFSNGIIFLISFNVNVTKTNKVVKNAYLAYISGFQMNPQTESVGNLFEKALYIAKNTKNDLLSGFYHGYITEDVVTENKGHTTISALNLELYNSPNNINITDKNFHLPIF